MVERTSSRTTQQSTDDGSRALRCSHQPQQLDARPSQQQQLTPERAPAAGSGHRFSLFGWFRRRNSISVSDGRRPKHQIFRGRNKRRSSSSSSSSSSSVGTSYSTATVRSFAFHVPVRCVGDSGNVSIVLERQNRSDRSVGPFAPGAIKLVETRKTGASSSSANTSTLPSAFLHRQDLQTRYSLLPVNTSSFISFDSIPVVDCRPRAFAFQTRGNRDESVCTSDSSLSGVVRRVHVRGKRRAPEPPLQQIINIHVAAGASGGASVTGRPAARGRRKRRPAPKPPGFSDTGLSSNRDTLSSEASTGMDSLQSDRESHTISNDTLVLRKGVLLAKKYLDSPSKSGYRTPPTSNCDSDVDTIVSDKPTTSASNVQELGTLMLRPWYKRNVLVDQPSTSRDSHTNSRKGGGDILRGLPSPLTVEKEDESVPSMMSTSSSTASSPFENSLSRLNFFQRSDRHRNDDRKKESKRKSGVSILTNITELDKEAAAIVQQEQAKNRASMILQAARLDEDLEKRMRANESIIQEIVNSSLENSPRKSTKALISKFNALGNLSKTTVGNNFFSRSNNSSPKTQPKRFSQEWSNGLRDLERNRSDRDTKKSLFLPDSLPKRDSASIFTEIINVGKPTVASAQLKSTRSQVPATVTADRKSTETNTIFEKAIASDLDDVAMGIAKLRRELDDRPKKIEEAVANQENVIKRNQQETPIVLNKLKASKDKEFVNFDREFNRIFGEINRQLQTKDSGVTSSSVRIKENVIPPNHVARVLNILSDTRKNDSPPITIPLVSKKQAPITNTSVLPESESIPNEKEKSTVGAEVVPDKSTVELRMMLREMEHPLPKPSKTGNGSESSKHVENSRLIRGEINKSSTTFESSPESVSSRKVSTKVSSGVQTNGNVRRIVGEAEPHIRSSDNVLPEVNRSTVDSHQLIKANESESVTRKEPFEQFPENTYANVMENSLYANAQAIPKAGCKVVSDKCGQSCSSSSKAKIELRAEDSGLPLSSPALLLGATNISPKAADEAAGNVLDFDTERNIYKNTVAVNRLLRKLEAAIAAGDHQQAARLARELAQLKIHCSVVRQRSRDAKLLRLNLYIEDKQEHQGPIPLRLPVKMSVAQLKAKIQIEFDIPANVQRWIIGKNLVHNDESTLEDLQAVNESPVFLYLIAPKDPKPKAVIKEDEKGLDNYRNEEKIPEKEEEKDGDGKQNHENEPKNQPIVENDPAEGLMEATGPGVPEVRENSLSKEEKLQRYEELISLENCDLIPTTEPFECPVCFMIYGPNEGIILRDCLHTFCRSCAANVVRYCEEAEVRCPYRDADYTCESTLQEREIKALVPVEVYQQHLAKSVAQAENSAGKNAFHCKTPDCAGWCIYDDDVNNFLCPVCKANNCLTCQAIHRGRNCREYQEELKYPNDTDHESKRTAAMLEEMVEKGEALPCPTCAVVLMKKWGCDWLRCSMCKTEICWVTRGPRWGPAGKGDTSGGCKCGENGVKCHPKCNYCH